MEAEVSHPFRGCISVSRENCYEKVCVFHTVILTSMFLIEILCLFSLTAYLIRCLFI